MIFWSGSINFFSNYSYAVVHVHELVMFLFLLMFLEFIILLA